jgi:hypothetical protein
MTKPFELTDAMQFAAEEAYLKNSERAVETTPLEAAIQVFSTIEASGLVEENVRLRSNIEGLSKIIRDSIKENDGPDRVWIDGIAYEGPLADNYFKAMRLILTSFDLILNKEST